MNTPATHYTLFDPDGDWIPELLVFGRDAGYDSAGFELYKYQNGRVRRIESSVRYYVYHIIVVRNSQMYFLNDAALQLIEGPKGNDQIDCLVQNGHIVGGYRIGSEYDILQYFYGN